ncbi:MAG: formimidoylglutamase [Bacteroidetes bacterium]|nr:MAG: formimidoylglutamase [Bacteroidota bacterium]UCE68275.1 MAG: formimidoylglutamase [Flavobacteriaceae bacterium]
MNCYQTPDAGSWKGRPSADRAYLHENIRLLDLSAGDLPKQESLTPVLLGYACDEGVVRNLGRPGARNGPQALRGALGKLPLLREGSLLWDAGDLACTDGDLETLQQEFSEAVYQLLHCGYFPLAIGGGHDIAFAHFLGLCRAKGPETSIGILNFDAHLDLRTPLPRSHSGSPFLQIAHLCKEQGREFHYGCLGVRRDANAQELWDRATSLGAMTVGREDMEARKLDRVMDRIVQFMEPLDAVYLTIDLDGFSSAYAPGVSAASPMGFSPEVMMPCLDIIISSGKLLSMDIAELNPGHDRDAQTAVLAASLVHRLLHFPGLF